MIDRPKITITDDLARLLIQRRQWLARARDGESGSHESALLIEVQIAALVAAQYEAAKCAI